MNTKSNENKDAKEEMYVVVQKRKRFDMFGIFKHS